MALAGFGCGSNATNPYPQLTYSTADGGADAQTGRGMGSGTASTSPGTPPSTSPTDGGRLLGDGGVDALVVGTTFSELFANIFSVSCAGGDCHNPASRGGVSFFTELNGYNSVRNFVKPGNASGSELFLILASGQMPKNGPPLSPSELAMVASWINAGALNN